jgi:hypothetical protein
MADPSSLAIRAMGSAQMKGKASSRMSVRPGPEEDTISSMPKEPPETKM